MANQQHIEWLLEGVKAWNARRERERFRPDFENADLRAAFEQAGKLDGVGRADLLGANLREADITGADLRGVVLRGAVLIGTDLIGTDLRGADLREADLRRAVLRGAVLTGANVESIVYSAAGTKDQSAAEYTDLSTTVDLIQEQVDLMKGDSGTLLPGHLKRPDHWPEIEVPGNEAPPSDESETPSPVRYTPPAEFQTKAWKLDVQHFPERPQPRKASNTPVDADAAETTRTGFAELVSTFCSALRKYKREDAKVSNRVRAAEQLLVTADALLRTLRLPKDEFLPTLLEDYVESIALGFNEDVQAFEANDVALYQRVIKRGRQLYAFYPELAEISDPTNTRFITEGFPYTVDQLSAELNRIVYSEEGLQHFSDSTRELIEAETNAAVPRDQDAEKTKLARLGAIVGEMRREMTKYANKGKEAVDTAASWLKSYEKVEKIWEAIKPFIGMGGEG